MFRSVQSFKGLSKNVLSRQAKVFGRFHSSVVMAKSLSNEQGRLRVHEETYADRYSTPIPSRYTRVLDSLAKHTHDKLPNAFMMIGSLQSKMLYQLVKLFQPTHILEIGGLTGYSAIAMAAALKEQGKLISLELQPEYIKISREYIQAADLQHKIQVIQGPAHQSILQLANESPKMKYDLIFLDADKGGYIDYYETIMEHDLLSDQGVIVADNVLYYGEVHRAAGFEAPNDEASKNIKKMARTVHKFNEHVSKDSRSEVVMLPLFDGLTLIRKKNVV